MLCSELEYRFKLPMDGTHWSNHIERTRTSNITVQVNSTIANGGTICVTPSNSCGTGPARCKTVNVYNFKDNEIDAETISDSELNFEYYPNQHNQNSSFLLKNQIIIKRSLWNY
ncbi:MAG: hypothetical protein R2809_00470 [Flavobacteriales bacterium]